MFGAFHFIFSQLTNQNIASFSLVARKGIEPLFIGHEPIVLPLDYPAMVVSTGIEPILRGASILCSTN